MLTRGDDAMRMLLGVALWIAGCSAVEAQTVIVIGDAAPPLEQYAARELQRYLYQLSGTLPAIQMAKGDTQPAGPAFLIGRTADHPLLAKMAAAGTIKITLGRPGSAGIPVEDDRGRAARGAGDRRTRRGGLPLRRLRIAGRPLRRRLLSGRRRAAGREVAAAAGQGR